MVQDVRQMRGTSVVKRDSGGLSWSLLAMAQAGVKCVVSQHSDRADRVGADQTAIIVYSTSS